MIILSILWYLFLYWCLSYLFLNIIIKLVYFEAESAQERFKNELGNIDERIKECDIYAFERAIFFSAGILLWVLLFGIIFPKSKS